MFAERRRLGEEVSAHELEIRELSNANGFGAVLKAKAMQAALLGRAAAGRARFRGLEKAAGRSLVEEQAEEVVRCDATEVLNARISSARTTQVALDALLNEANAELMQAADLAASRFGLPRLAAAKDLAPAQARIHEGIAAAKRDQAARGRKILERLDIAVSRVSSTTTARCGASSRRCGSCGTGAAWQPRRTTTTTRRCRRGRGDRAAAPQRTKISHTVGSGMRHPLRLLLPLPVLIVGACTPAEAPPDPPPAAPATFVASDSGLVAPDGRQMLLRGVNARVEGLFDVTFDDGRQALEEIPPFTGADCRVLAELGLNLLRLPVNWSAIEPEPGEYQQVYAGRLLALVDACHAVGVYTLVDLHQDAYSKHIGEDGAPLWAIVPPPDELLQGPLADLEERRRSPQVLRSFRNFFDDTEGVQGAFVEMAAWLAGQIAGRPGVVGLEIFNEPVAFDDAALDSFHRRVADAARAAAPALPLAFEPDALRNFTDSDPVAFARPFRNALYAPHHYTDVFTDGWASGDVDSLRASVAGIAAEARIHGAHGLVGEFGHDPKTPNGLTWLRESLQAYDEHRLSWAMWLYEEWSQDAWGLYDYVDNGAGPERAAMREDVADLLARPFPQAIAGVLLSTAWDPSTLTLSVELDGAGTHTLAAPLRIWPQGPVATCDDLPVEVRSAGPGRVDVDCDGTRLRLLPPG